MQPTFILGLRTAIVVLAAGISMASAAPLKTLLIDGQNNHNWRQTTPILKAILEETGLFTVEVATAPPKGPELANFKPNFQGYRVLVSNYNGEPWSRAMEEAFAAFVRSGGGFVSVHAANNSFPEWTEYNAMIGVGGWGGRTEKHGPYLRLRGDRFVPDPIPGRGGSHGSRHAFVLDTRAPNHVIMSGLPLHWMHAQDELYDRLRGPAKNLTVLASALSTKESGGSGEHEPLLMALTYGQGRVFHTALGHDAEAMNCVGFAVTLQRGTEWAATGKVTQPVPANFPGSEKVVPRR